MSEFNPQNISQLFLQLILESTCEWHNFLEYDNVRTVVGVASLLMKWKI